MLKSQVVHEGGVINVNQIMSTVTVKGCHNL